MSSNQSERPPPSSPASASDPHNDEVEGANATRSTNADAAAMLHHLHPDRVRPPPSAAHRVPAHHPHSYDSYPYPASSAPSTSRDNSNNDVLPPPLPPPVMTGRTTTAGSMPATTLMGGPSVNDDNLEDPPRALSPAMDVALYYQNRQQYDDDQQQQQQQQQRQYGPSSLLSSSGGRTGGMMLPSEAARRSSDPTGDVLLDAVAANGVGGVDPIGTPADVYSRSLLSQSYNTAERFFHFASPHAASLSPTRRRMEAAAAATASTSIGSYGSPGIIVGGTQTTLLPPRDPRHHVHEHSHHQHYEVATPTPAAGVKAYHHQHPSGRPTPLMGGAPVASSSSGTATPLTSNLALLLASQSSEAGDVAGGAPQGGGSREHLGMPSLGMIDDDNGGNGGTGDAESGNSSDEGYAVGLGENQHTPRPGEPILKRSHHTYSPESDSASAAAAAAISGAGAGIAASAPATRTTQEPAIGSGGSGSSGGVVSFDPAVREILPLQRPPPVLGSSAPGRFLLPPQGAKATISGQQRQPQPALLTGSSRIRPLAPIVARSASAITPGRPTGTSRSADSALHPDDTVRRCQSVYEMRRGNTGIAPSSYTDILQKKKSIEATLQMRLSQRREASTKELLQAQSQMRRLSSQSSRPLSPTGEDLDQSQQGSQASSSALRMTNNRRKCRRAEHNRAVIHDLCEIVADLFLAESKLLHSATAGSSSAGSGGIAGMDGISPDRDSVLSAVALYLADLPVRYALGVDSPSEVLLHMRLMTAARADPTRAAVHIANVDDGDSHVAAGTIRPGCRLVTICCADADGLLEFITKLLQTGGARVLDADVMLTSDNIALDRFVVEMKGRLRLDKLQNYIESYLREARDFTAGVCTADGESTEKGDTRVKNTTTSRPPKSSESAPLLPSFPSHPSQNKLRGRSGSVSASAYGPVYFHPPKNSQRDLAPRRLQDEIQSAVPLSQMVSSTSIHNHPDTTTHSSLSRQQSGGPPSRQSSDSPKTTGQSTGEDSGSRSPPTPPVTPPRPTGGAAAATRRRSRSDVGVYNRQRQMLVNREAAVFTNSPEHGNGTLPEEDDVSGGLPSGIAVALETQQRSAHRRDRTVPLIPLDELMLIETLGTGRISTIYRAAWRMPQRPESPAIVALKVATVDLNTADTSCIEELHHEADIAAILEHQNICSLVGIASDQECFCLAYEYCEGGSLLSLLSDTSRYYEYLPIALDIANGMAYLHSRQVIHRDLKPSNVLLTRNNRAKISDFGMSVAMTGQELTAETGTYRWMAPEVIRHESYSSNADVYSFGVVLWQLITREVPFATMTPIQTAYAVAEGHRPDIPASVPEPLRNIIEACWHEDQSQRPSFTYIAMALADYAKLAFNPNAVGAQTVRIANEIIGSVQGNSTVNVDLSVGIDHRRHSSIGMSSRADSSPGGRGNWFGPSSYSSGGTGAGNIGLEI